MKFTHLLEEEAQKRGYWPPVAHPSASLDAPGAFTLVRDMPYGRADSWEPEAIIAAWRGTCSGKHYLLKAILKELGFSSHILACTQKVTAEMATHFPASLRSLLEKTPYVDIHNYLLVQTPQGEMIVDATWPVAVGAFGLPVNENWIWGKDMNIGCSPLQTFLVPTDADPQSFKDGLLREHFTTEELAHREAVIALISRIPVG